jgi:hypothetical protein
MQYCTDCGQMVLVPCKSKDHPEIERVFCPKRRTMISFEPVIPEKVFAFNRALQAA